jgi:hypothetical protein
MEKIRANGENKGYWRKEGLIEKGRANGEKKG